MATNDLGRELKPGEYIPEDTPTTAGPELVRVHHSGLDVTKVVRRRQLPQMDPGWEVIEPEELKGEALESALKDAGLPTTGTADEKRARLAEHEAAALVAASDADRDVVVSTENKE